MKMMTIPLPLKYQGSTHVDSNTFDKWSNSLSVNVLNISGQNNQNKKWRGALNKQKFRDQCSGSSQCKTTIAVRPALAACAQGAGNAGAQCALVAERVLAQVALSWEYRTLSY